MIFGQHDERTLIQFQDVTSRAEKTALMADGHVGYVMPIGGVAAYTLEYQQRVSFLQRGALKSLAKTDPLTGLYNRGAINQKLNHLVDYAYRENKTITLMLLDVDFFKPFNDHYGHIAGDKCLIQVANALSSHCKRPLDFSGRYGGEEFLLVLANTGVDGAEKTAQRLRELIVATSFEHIAEGLQITVSCGVTEYRPKENLEKLLARGDQAMYEAKRGGRDQVVVHR